MDARAFWQKQLEEAEREFNAATSRAKWLDQPELKPKACEYLMADPIPCPFVYSTGKRCTGHVTKVEAYKADLEWTFDDGKGWTFSASEPRFHYHVFCSAKGNHAGPMRADALKFYYSQLPDALKQVINQPDRRHGGYMRGRP